jgi:hypothetical protein
MQVLRNSTMHERSLWYLKLLVSMSSTSSVRRAYSITHGKNVSDETSVESQKSIGVWLEVEDTWRWFVHAVPKAVSHVLSSCSLHSNTLAVSTKRPGLLTALLLSSHT